MINKSRLGGAKKCWIIYSVCKDIKELIYLCRWMRECSVNGLILVSLKELTALWPNLNMGQTDNKRKLELSYFLKKIDYLSLSTRGFAELSPSRFAWKNAIQFMFTFITMQFLLFPLLSLFLFHFLGTWKTKVPLILSNLIWCVWTGWIRIALRLPRSCRHGLLVVEPHRCQRKPPQLSALACPRLCEQP